LLDSLLHETSMTENCVGRLIDKEGVVFVIKVEHKTSSSGHRKQNILEQTDLFLVQEGLSDNFCRKDKETNTQMKFSCTCCRKVLESVDALKCHLKGGKHAANLENPQDSTNYVLENGKWKPTRGSKRSLPEDLSRREQTKKNKIHRNIPILAQHTQEKYNETETYFDEGYRRVRPYYFTFVAHAKGRWVGQELWSVFSREFRAMEEQEFARCIEAGLVKVNGNSVTLDYKIGNNDFISHKVHRHELPVTDKRIEIIFEDDDILVVDKPGSVPVHPCGRYRHNTVTFILAKELGYKALHTVHRLDRLTSGVLIFAKSAQKSREMFELISERQVTKEYLCRVDGEFPSGEVVCDQPILVISYKIGLCVVSEEGKSCKTVFERVSYKDGVSVVRCKPLTGRMHQIRVHLQYLGFPISNDPLYNSNIFGPTKGKDGIIGKSKEELIEALIAEHTVENWLKTDQYQNSRISKNEDGDCESEDETEEALFSTATNLPSSVKENESKEGTCIGESNLGDASGETKEDTSSELETKRGGNEFWDEHCVDCTKEFKDPPRDAMLIYLHAVKYSGEGWQYETKLPSWSIL